MNENSTIEIFYNNIITGSYKKNLEICSSNYIKNPQNTNLLFGVYISYILLDKLTEAINFFEKELTISPLQNKIKLLISFIKAKNINPGNGFSNIYNTGLYLKKNNLFNDAIIFFKVCNLLKPNDENTLTILGEYALLSKDYDKSLKLFAQSAKIKKEK